MAFCVRLDCLKYTHGHKVSANLPSLLISRKKGLRSMALQSVSTEGAGTPSSVRLMDADHDPPVGGVATERVDPHTLEVIQFLFREKGLQFFAALLHLAVAKQCPLPGFAESTSCAVITARNIRELAKHIGWGYDTTEKYLVILCALHLLYKEKSPDGIAYYFPLCRYCPPAGLETLEGIIADYRSKVASFGRKVKRRFVVYLGQQKSPVSVQPALANAPAFDLSGALADIEHITLKALGNGNLQHQLLVQIKGALQYRCQHTEETGDSGDLPPVQKSPDGTKTGDFSGSPKREKSSVSKTGDFSVVVATRNGRLPAQSGDFPSASQGHTKTEKLPVSAQKGDSVPIDSFPNRQLSIQGGDSSSQMGDFAPEQVPNVNVILRNLLDSLNDNDKSTVIEFLRIIFDEAPRKRGYYHNLYKNYKHPDAWLAAAIETLIAYRGKKTTTDPGKYFYDLCVTFHQQGIPVEVAEHVQQYSFLPYGQLLAVLGRTIPARSSAPATRVPTRSVKAEQRPVVPQVPCEKDRPGMSLADAKRAVVLLKSNARTDLVQVARYQRPDGSRVLLISEDMERPRQRWIYSLQDLQRRLASMKTLNDFFEQEERR